MLTSRGQENIVHTRPTNGKALQPKTPGNLQTPRTTNRTVLGAKTTNAKAQTIFRDQKDAKFQAFKTPAPGQQKIKPEKTVNQPSASKRSGRAKISVAQTESTKADALTNDVEDDEPDFGYAPPPPVELPDPPMEFGYDQSFPQFRPENMFRGYGQLYDSSPKDENGFSIRLRREEEEYRAYRDQEEQELLKKIRKDMAKKIVLSDDEFDLSSSKATESNPDTLKSKSAASALSGTRLPSVASKQTTSSKLKMSKPIHSREPFKSAKSAAPLHTKPLSVSKNTIGFPKAKPVPPIVPKSDSRATGKSDKTQIFDDDLSDFEFERLDLDDEQDIFQL